MSRRRNIIKIPVLSLVLFFASAMVLFAEDKPIELLKAETMRKVTPVGDKKDTYIFFDKDVHLRQGEINILTDRAYQYPEQDLLRLEGNVYIYNDSVQIYFEQGSYNTKTRDIEVPSPVKILYDSRTFTAMELRGNLDKDVYRARGNVEIQDSVSYAAADSLLFDRENSRAFLYGEALMSDTVNHMSMRGSELEYRLDTDQFYGHKDASVYESGADGKKRFEVFAEFLRGDTKEGWLIARGNVYVQQDSAAAWCDSLFYSDSLGTVDLFDNVQLRYKNIDMYANTMCLRFHGNRLYDLYSSADPRVTLKDEGYFRERGAKPLSTLSEVKGKNLYLKFNDEDAPDWMRMSGMVLSEYHVFKDSVYKGINHMSSDTLRLHFDSGELYELLASYDVRGDFTPDSSYEEMDTTALYLGNEAHYDLRIDRMSIYPAASMNYGDIQLRADTLKIDWEHNILYAIPKKGGERPEFIQGKDAPVYGDLFEYNLETERGRITRGKTHIKEAYYHGKSVLKTEDKPLYVHEGVLSTCDLDEPHFCIEAKRMKVIPGDRVFAQDIVFKVMDIPLLYAPSIFVSIEEGDPRSGWILPSFGRFNSRGWALEKFGYYWAPNDYYDARFIMDFYDNYGIKAELRQRYAWRHHISNGSLSLEYWNYFLSDEPAEGYRININHPQTIGLRSKLNISGTFTNDSQQFSRELDKDQRLQQQIVSNASFSTALGPFSMNINVHRKEDLLTGNSTTNFPQLSISRPNTKIFKRRKLSDPEKWFHKFSYSMNSKMVNEMTHTWNSRDSLFYDVTKDKVESNVKVLYNDKLFGFLSISPYLQYYEDWTTRYYKPTMQNDSACVDEKGNLILEEVRGFKRRGRFDLGSTASTTLYGVFNLNLGPLKAVRHTLGMSLNYVYKPDLSYNPDYVFRGPGRDGKDHVYDYFSSTLLPATPSQDNQNIFMNFNHTFESKMQRKEQDEKKMHFLTLKHSYNFLADSLRSSEIIAASTLRDLPGGLSLKLDANFDPYAYRVNEDGVTITRIDQLAIPRITYFRLATDFRMVSGTSRRQQTAEIAAEADTNKLTLPAPKAAPGSDEGFSRWTVNAGLSFTSNAANPLNVNNRLLFNTEIKANLTPKWTGSYSIKFDVLEHRITDQRISLSRDLHCWALQIDWNPGDSFFIRINAKSDLLKALKWEKQTGKHY